MPTPRVETSPPEDPTATNRPRPDRRKLIREDGAVISLPGARAPIPLRDATAVWDAAVCAQTDPEVFFPERGQSLEPAKAVCAACPVRELCLDTFGPVIDHGVVGGLTPDQRRARFGSGAAA